MPLRCAGRKLGQTYAPQLSRDKNIIAMFCAGAQNIFIGCADAHTSINNFFELAVSPPTREKLYFLPNSENTGQDHFKGSGIHVSRLAQRHADEFRLSRHGGKNRIKPSLWRAGRYL